MQFSISGQHRRTFTLSSETGQELATLFYPKWYTMRRATITRGATTWHTEAAGFFNNRTIVTENGQEVMQCRFRGLGRMEITLRDGSNYTLRRVGFFRAHMALLTESGHEVVRIYRTSAWAMFHIPYAVETDNNYPAINDPAVLLVLMYCINYMRAVSASV